ncbi:MAG: glycosyltransferase, partial [bacterium]|nr:glycosyltransferase [bacterium]
MARSNPKIKVANVIVDLSMGGIEKTTLNLCANLDPDVFDPVVVCISGGGPLEEEARALDVPTEITGVPVRNLPKAVWALKKTFAKLRPDVIHGNPGMIARLAAPRGVPVISTYHNTLVGRNELSRAIDRMLAKRSVYIVAVSEYILHSTARSIGLVREAIPVVYHGFATERMRRLAQSATPLLSLGAPCGVFIGRH